MNKQITFGAYSAIAKAGNLYFVAGQVGVDPETKQAPKSVDDQLRQAFANLKNALSSAGLGLDSVVKTTLYLVNIEDFESVNMVYSNYFLEPSPARSTVAVKQLPKVGGINEILIEIEAVAYKETK